MPQPTKLRGHVLFSDEDTEDGGELAHPGPVMIAQSIRVATSVSLKLAHTTKTLSIAETSASK